MKDLMKEMRTLIEMYFDKKIKNITMPEEIKDKIWEEVDNAIDEIDEIVREVDIDVDYEIEENTGDFLPTYEEEMLQDFAFRERELIDISRDNALTR